MNKICGYSCEHNKSGVCQISICDKKTYMLDKTEIKHLSQSYYDLHEKYYKLQQENKKLNGVVQTYDILLKANVEENKQLKRIIKENTILVKDEYGDYQECNINPLRMKQKYEKQVDNWNKLKEYIRENIIYDDVGMKILDPSPLEDYMQELEKGSDK